MGNLLSKSKTRSDDYEKILSELDAKIQKAEIRLSEIKLRERRWGVLWMLYTTIVWAAHLLYCIFVLHNRENTLERILLVALPVLVIPVLIYYGRKTLRWFYTRKQSREEANLASLRAEQKLKVEELKKKTSYYTTKSLLDRYENGSSAKRQEQQQQQQQQDQRRPAPQVAGPAVGAAPQLQLPANASMRSATPAVPQPMQTALRQPRERQWYDRLIDAVVGDEGPETKFALVCNHCFAHNGLVLPQEIDTIQYVCPQCKKFNPSRKSRQLHPDGPVIPPSTPTSRPNSAIMQDDQPEEKRDTEQTDKSPSESNSDEKSDEDMLEGEDTIAARVRRRHQRESNGEEDS